MESTIDSRMSVRSALKVLTQRRDDSTLVVTNQGSARVWPRLTDHPLDFHYNPSTMGGAVSFGLGLALAKPQLKVVVVTGDGALLMSLGSLISVVAARARNITVVVLDNGMYEVTGGQKTAASDANVDYVALAKAVGFASAFSFSDEVSWCNQSSAAFASAGPRLISLCVERADAADMATSLTPISERVAAIQQYLGQTE